MRSPKSFVLIDMKISSHECARYTFIRSLNYQIWTPKISLSETSWFHWSNGNSMNSQILDTSRCTRGESVKSFLLGTGSAPTILEVTEFHITLRHAGKDLNRRLSPFFGHARPEKNVILLKRTPVGYVSP